MKSRKRIVTISIIILLALLSITGICIFISINIKEQNNHESEDRIIQVFIIESGSYLPLSNCTVSLAYVDNLGWHDDIEEIHFTETNEEGRFSFIDIKTPDDFENEVNRIRVEAWDEFHFYQRIRISFDEINQPITMVLSPGGRISGNINHNYLEDDELYLCAYRSESEKGFFPIHVNKNGEYKTNLIPYGQYNLFICSNKYIPTQSTSVSVVNGIESKINITMTKTVSNCFLHLNTTMNYSRNPVLTFYFNQDPVLCFSVAKQEMTIALPYKGNYTLKPDTDHYMIIEEEDEDEIEIKIIEGYNHFDFELYYIPLP